MNTTQSPDYILALTIRAALIQIVRAIEKRFNIKAHVFDVTIVTITENDTLTSLPQKSE